MCSSWFWGREGSTRCLVDSWDSTVQPYFVFGTLWDAFSSAPSFLALEWISFLDGMAASIGTSNFLHIHHLPDRWNKYLSVFERYRVLVSRLTILAFFLVSGFSHFGPNFKPQILRSGSCLNFALGESSCERDHESGTLETNSFTGMLFDDDWQQEPLGGSSRVNRISSHPGRCSSSTQSRRTASLGPGQWRRARNSQNHGVSLACGTWAFWSSRNDRFSAKRAGTQTHHRYSQKVQLQSFSRKSETKITSCCCSTSSWTKHMSSIWPIWIETSSVEPARAGNHHGGCWKSCCFRDNPQSHGHWTWIWAMWQVKSCWIHCWITGSSAVANQTFSEPIQKGSLSRSGVSKVLLPRVSALTLILETRPGKQECMGKHWIPSNSVQYVRPQELLTVSQFKKSLMNALRLTMTHIEIEASLRGSRCWEERHRQTSQFVKILIWLSAVSKLWTKLQSSVSVWRKGRTKRNIEEELSPSQNVAKKFIKPILEALGSRWMVLVLEIGYSQGFEKEKWCVPGAGTCVASRTRNDCWRRS